MNKWFSDTEVATFFSRFIHPYYFTGFFFIRKNTGINQFQYLLQVLVLCFFFLTDYFKGGIDLIKSFAQRLNISRCMFYIKIPGEIAVMNRLNKLVQFLCAL